VATPSLDGGATAAAPDPFAEGPAPAPGGFSPDTARGLALWLLLLLTFGVGGVLLGLNEAAALVAIAGLFIAAQAADLDARWKLLYWMLTWVVPAGGAAAFLGIGSLAGSSPLPGGLRIAMTVYCAIAAGVCLLLVWRPVVDPITVRLFHEDPPTHSLRLTTRLAVAGLLLAVPGSLLLRDQLAQMVADNGRLFDPSGLAGQLIGMVVIALAAVGFLVRRDLRGTLERLGLARPTAGQWLLAGVGAGTLYLFNAGAEQVQHAWFPAQWAADRAMGELMVKDIAPAGALMLGITAGVGEELTLRGALQPRLGLVLTSVLFAALHVQYSWFGMGMILVFGLLLGTLRARTSTTVVIVVHALYDVMAVLTT
jgi:hypothetical protein